MRKTEKNTIPLQYKNGPDKKQHSYTIRQRRATTVSVVHDQAMIPQRWVTHSMKFRD